MTEYSTHVNGAWGGLLFAVATGYVIAGFEVPRELDWMGSDLGLNVACVMS